MSRFKGEYPPDWSEIAERIKGKANWKCERCGHPHDPENGYALTSHHLTNNKSECADWNIAALCQKCHLTIQGKVEMRQFWLFEHSEWMKPHVEGYLESLEK